LLGPGVLGADRPEGAALLSRLPSPRAHPTMRAAAGEGPRRLRASVPVAGVGTTRVDVGFLVDWPRSPSLRAGRDRRTIRRGPWLRLGLGERIAPSGSAESPMISDRNLQASISGDKAGRRPGWWCGAQDGRPGGRRGHAVWMVPPIEASGLGVPAIRVPRSITSNLGRGAPPPKSTCCAGDPVVPPTFGATRLPGRDPTTGSDFSAGLVPRPNRSRDRGQTRERPGPLPTVDIEGIEPCSTRSR